MGNMKPQERKKKKCQHSKKKKKTETNCARKICPQEKKKSKGKNCKKKLYPSKDTKKEQGIKNYARMTKEIKTKTHTRKKKESRKSRTIQKRRGKSMLPKLSNTRKRKYN